MAIYSQVAGFQVDWYKREQRRLAGRIAGDDSPLMRHEGTPGAELVLGIRPSGASYLLLCDQQLGALIRAYNLVSPDTRWQPHDFLSLSPVNFVNAEQLADELGKYAAEYKRDKIPRDNSKRNKGFWEDQVHLVNGPPRAAFEHHRLLYRIMCQRRTFDYVKFSLDPTSWEAGPAINIVSFAFTLWSHDQRTAAQSRRDPIVLDLGWCGRSVITDEGYDINGDNFRFVAKQHQRLGQSAAAFEYGPTEILEHQDIGARLRSLTSFRPDLVKLLLVYDFDKAKPVFDAFGVDYAPWTAGVASLFSLDTTSPAPRAGTYVVDMRALATTMYPAPDTAGVLEPISELRAYARQILPEHSEAGLNAANDARLLLHMWVSLARGTALDLQLEEREPLREVRRKALMAPDPMDMGDPARKKNPYEQLDDDPSDDSD